LEGFKDNTSWENSIPTPKSIMREKRLEERSKTEETKPAYTTVTCASSA